MHVPMALAFDAVCLVARAVRKAVDAAARDGQGGARLISLQGGDKHNAIPREASAKLAVATSALPSVLAAVSGQEDLLRLEYSNEPHASLQATVVEDEDALDAGAMEPMDEESTQRTLDVLNSIPHGALKFSTDVPNLPETSNNLAAVDTRQEAMGVLCSSRSFIAGALDATRDTLRAIASTMGRGTVHMPPAYPGWQPNRQSRLLTTTKAVLGRVLAEEAGDACAEAPPEPSVLAIHAGLECGLIGEKCQTDEEAVDMVSFGPTIVGAHSPDEKVKIGTVAPFFVLTKRVLGQLAH